MEKLTLKFLQTRVKHCMELAKGFLIDGQAIAPVCIFGKMGMGEHPEILDLSTPEMKEVMAGFVQTSIKKTDSDYAIIITDAYMLKLDRKGISVDEAMKEYVPGMATNSPDRIEVINVVGESKLGGYSIFQEYHRNGNGIIFDEVDAFTNQSEIMESALFGTVWDEIRAKRATTH